MSPRLSAFSLILAGLLVAQPGVAQTYSTVPQQTDADALAAAMRTVASSPQNVDALITAGELSLRLGDASGAAALFARADKVDPRNGRVKAGMASILVHEERPGEALRYFDQAVGYGLPPARFAAERGLAYDLIGEQERAQRDYRLALASGANDEVVRRYGLSLGISGKRDAALEQLDSLIRKGDRGAWRARAFVLAMNGDVPGANTIATTMMPPGMAQGLGPFFQRLPALSAADRAFAVHYGETRPTPERVADARMVPALPVLAPEPGRTTALAAAQPTRASVQTAAVDQRKSRRDRRSRREREQVQTAAVAPAVTPTPAAMPTPPAYAAAMVQPLPGVAPRAATAAPLTLAQRTPLTATPAPRYAAPATPPLQTYVARTPTSPAVTRAATPTQSATTGAIATPLTTPAARSSQPPSPVSPVTAPTSISPAPVTRATTGTAPIARGVVAAAGTSPAAGAATPSVPSSGARVGLAATSTTAPSAARVAVPAAGAATPVTVASVVPTTIRPTATPATTGVGTQLAAVTSPTAAAPTSNALPANATPPRVNPSVARPPSTVTAIGRTQAGKQSSLAAIMAGISVPSSELAVAPAAAPLVPRGTRVAVARAAGTTPGTRPTATVAATGKAGRSAVIEEADAAPANRRKGRLAATDEPSASPDASETAPTRGKGRQLAAADTAKRKGETADTSATTRRRGGKTDDAEVADAKSAKLTPAQKKAAEKKALADTAAADERKAAKAEPERIWVQVAGGANESDLTKAWRAQQGKAAALKGRAAYATPLRATNRVVTGPFKTDAEARAFVNQLAKQGVSAFPFTSDKGQKMTKLPTK